MEQNDGSSNMRYDRWNEENINTDVVGSQPMMVRIHSRLCLGTTGNIVKSVAAMATLVVMYVIGYVTGYYVHRC